MSAKLKILITGIGGNVGQYIANDMHSRGYNVIGIYRNRFPKVCNYELVKADLYHGIPESINVDVIIHVAAAINGSTDKLIEDNIVATKKLLEFAEHAGCKQFIYMSTVSVYGKVDGELNIASDIVNPAIYGVTKYLAESLVKESKIPSKMIIRLPRMLGPFVDLRHAQGSGFLTMTKKILNDEDVQCYIPNVLYNNYMHVSDLTDFIDKVMEKEQGIECKTVLLGTREKLRMIDILKIMIDEIGSKSEIKAMENGTFPKCSEISILEASKMGYSPLSAKRTLQRFIKEMEGNKYGH